MKTHLNGWVQATACSLILFLASCGGGDLAADTSSGNAGSAFTLSANDRDETDESSPLGAVDDSVIDESETVVEPDAQLTAQALAQAEEEALQADSSQPLESLPLGSIASKEAYVSGAIARKAAVAGVPAYRFYNASTAAHFYTSSVAEADDLLADFSSAFHLEGPAFWVATAPSSGLSPVHRFYNAQTGVHFYTISEAERAQLVAARSQFRYEGVAYHASQVAGAGMVPLYRFYVPSKGFHFYTASESEKTNIQANLGATYRYEGIGYYVLNSGPEAPELAPAPVPPVAGAPAAVLRATRISGPAPLAVMFDATASRLGGSGANAFHDLSYEFNFGNNNGQAWAISGQPKNTQAGGPLAAHVYEQPGTYTARVRVRAPNGQYSDATVSVTVQDPASVYSGTRTVCVSTSANYTGCPTGAARQTALPASLGGKRVLLRRSESFAAISVRDQDDRVQVGAYGTGAKPRVPSVQIGGGRAAEFPDDITVMDLDIANGIQQTGSASKLLILRNDLDDTGASANNIIMIGHAIDYWAGDDPYRVAPASAFYNPHEIFIVENRVIGSTENDDTPGGNLSGIGSRMALLGNDLGRSSQHTVRLYRANKTVIAHNAIRGMSSDGMRHSLKLHSGGFGAYNDNYAISGRAWASSQVVIANNLFSDPADNNAWTVAIRPQSTVAHESAEGIEDVIVENNRFARGRNTNTDVLLVGRRLATRGNVSTTTGQRLSISTDASTNYPQLPQAWRGPYFIN